MTRSQRLPSFDDVFDIAMAALLTGLAVVGLRASYGGSTYLVVGLVGVACGVAVVALMHRRAPALAGVAVLTGVYVVVGGVVAFRDRALLGGLPSIDTATASLDAAVAGWKQLLTTSPPVGDLGNLMALPFFCGLFGAGGSLLLARSNRFIPIAPTPSVLVLAFAIASGTPDPVSVVMHGALFAGGALWWMAVRYRRATAVVQLSQQDRRRRGVSAVAFLAAGAVVGFIVGPGLPLVHANDRALLRTAVDPPFDPRQYPSPLSQYREILKAREKQELFTIDGLPEGVPIRLATLDSFDGVVWHMSGADAATPGANGYFERVGSTITPDFPRTTTEITVTIGEWSEVWIPTVGEVTSIRFLGPRAEQLEAAFRYSARADTAALQGMVLQKDDQYVMEVVLPTALDEIADASGSDLIAMRIPTPDSAIPGALKEWAATVLQPDPIQRVRALTDKLTEDGFYSDGKKDQEQVPGGHSAGRLTRFVKSSPMFGNAEQYAAALALMLQPYDVATRVGVGFEPVVSSTGITTVRGVDLEAWVEVPLVGVGWSHVHPTPDRDKVPEDNQDIPQTLPERNTQVPLPPPIRGADPDSDPTTDPVDNDIVAPLAQSGGSWLATAIVIGGAALSIPLLTIVLPVAVIAWLKVRRRRRRRTEGSPSERISNGFHEVLDAVADLGRPLPENSTRRELAGFIGTPSAPVLAMAADRLVFSSESLTDDHVVDFWGGVDAVISELRGDLGRRHRWKATANLTSLRQGRHR